MNAFGTMSGLLVTIASVSSPPDSSHLISNHDYYVTGYNAVTQRFTVFNPWGAGLQNIGTLQLTAAQPSRIRVDSIRGAFTCAGLGHRTDGSPNPPQGATG